MSQAISHTTKHLKFPTLLCLKDIYSINQFNIQPLIKAEGIFTLI